MANRASWGAPTMPEPASDICPLNVRSFTPRRWEISSTGALRTVEYVSLTKPSTSSGRSPASARAR